MDTPANPRPSRPPVLVIPAQAPHRTTPTIPANRIRAPARARPRVRHRVRLPAAERRRGQIRGADGPVFPDGFHRHQGHAHGDRRRHGRRFSLRALGLVELHVKPTRYAANIAADCSSVSGSACSATAPGPASAALGQGNYDAIAGILGLMAGSYLYAETSGYLSSTIQKIGNRGGIMLPDLLGMRLAVSSPCSCRCWSWV
jgi:hypothetical protein